MSEDCPFVSDKEIFHYRDIYDHLPDSSNWLRHIATWLRVSWKCTCRCLNNQMTRGTQETNVTVRPVVTFIHTRSSCRSRLLAGIGGMSEWTMMTGQENWRIAYPSSWWRWFYLAWPITTLCIGSRSGGAARGNLLLGRLRHVISHHASRFASYDISRRTTRVSK